MNFYQTLFIATALSLPLIALLAVLRAVICAYRSSRTKHTIFLVLSIAGILLMLALLAAAVIAWFGYAVGHGGKDMTTDLILLAVTGIPIYGLACLIWWLCRRAEKRLAQQELKIVKPSP